MIFQDQQDNYLQQLLLSILPIQVITELSAAAGSMGVLTSGNSRAGVVDLDDGTYFIKSPDITAS